jgi:hypothetical protein
MTLSSDDDLNAELITRRLLPGSYNVTLRGDWYLEELQMGQAERVEQAVLLSPVTQYAYVWDGGAQTIYYVFGVGGDIIDFRSGTLNIGIQVEQPGDYNCGLGGAGVGGSSCMMPIAGAGMTGTAGSPSP